MAKDDNRQAYEARLMRVADYIYDNLDGDLSLDALAEVACMSRYHWHRVFRAMTGETLAEATRRIRLIRAANALIQTDAPLPEIAERHGYPNLASFSRAFTTAHGVSPGAFRERGVEVANQLRTHSGDDTMFPVIIEDLPPSRAAGILHVGPYPEVGRAFQKLGSLIASRNLFAHARGMIAVYHDAPDSKPDSEYRAHAALITEETFPTDIEELEYFDLVGGKHAIMQHKGPYATLGSAYEWLFGKWLPESGEEPRDAPPVEVYVNDPRTVPANEIRTDIRLPLI